tara:strand:+ start:79 stop:672 length:594 start_codon:yes stop_codon:yes gene_type:complete
MIKKGAMFGLDARIALAIFGALSVISGAALYSAVQTAKATAVIADMEELGKAWEQYYLDTGRDFEVFNTDDTDPYYHLFRTHYFNSTSGAEGWNGPYLPYETTGSYLLCNYEAVCRVFVMRYNSEDWSSTTWQNNVCESGKECSMWSRIYVHAHTKESLAVSIDKIVDNSDGQLTGNFRWDDTGYNLKIAPAKNPYN